MLRPSSSPAPGPARRPPSLTANLPFLLTAALTLLAAVASAQTPAQPPGQNIALAITGATATLTAGTARPPSTPQAAIDGDLTDRGAVRLTGLPAELTITFAEEKEVHHVRLYPGLLKNLANPSGACAPLDYEIDGYVNDGWAPLATVHDAPPPTATSTAEDYFFDHEFPPTYLSRLRLRITRSADTGKRLAPQDALLPPGQRTTALREIQAFTTAPAISPARAKKKGPAFLSGDFRLPYYRDQTTAALDLLVDEKAPPIPDPASIELSSPDAAQPLRHFTGPLQPGKNTVTLDIADLPSGRYPVTATITHDGTEEKITRLLRIDRGTPAIHQPDDTDLTGQVLYPIDDYQRESMQDLTVEVHPAEPHFAAWAALPPQGNHWQLDIGPLSVTPDGHLVIAYQSAEGDHLAWKYALCLDPQKPDQWEIHDGPAPPAADSAQSSGPGRRWQPRTPLGRATFRFYDPARDGVPPLAEIGVFHTGVVKRDFSGLPITYRGTYPVWEKTPGEILFLSHEPLLEDKTLPDDASFEQEKNTSDNFGGQFLSQDGKTLYYFVGNVVKRFPPFIAPYDNQRNSQRLFSVYSSHDGFTWTRQFILPLQDQDPWSLQQYGARIFRDPDANIYWGYLSTYDCERQQMHIDIIFSRDLLTWTRPGGPPFLANTTIPDTWLFGLILPSLPSLRLGDLDYLLLNSVVGSPHFYLDENITPEFLEKRFGPRAIDRWPYFQTLGGYPGLARSMQLAASRRPVGLATSRPHGLVALTAGAQPGTFIS